MATVFYHGVLYVVGRNISNSSNRVKQLVDLLTSQLKELCSYYNKVVQGIV